MPSAKKILIGDPGSARWKSVGLAVALFAIVTLFTYGPPEIFDMSSTHYFQGLTLGGFFAAAINAYYKGGLVSSWIIASMGLLPFAFPFAVTDAPIGQEPTFLGGVATILGSAGLFGLVIGTGGYLAGVGARYVIAQRREKETA